MNKQKAEHSQQSTVHGFNSIVFGLWSIDSLKILLFTMFCGLWSMDLLAKEIPVKSNTLVNDYANILSESEKIALEQKLVAYFDSTSTQIAVVIENSLEGDDLFDYSQRLATAWGIGEKGKNNGILIYAAIQDRKLRIHVGYGLEATITDALSTRIRTEHINPFFKEGQYYNGLDEGTTIMMQAASGEYVNDRPIQKGKKEFSWWKLVGIAIVLIIFMIRGGRGGRGGGIAGPIFWGTLGSGGFSGGGGSGGGGGGFGGFGGGGFGGGGSGGSW